MSGNGKSPSYSTYAAEILIDPVRKRMPLGAIGLLQLIESLCWMHGSVPDDVAEIALDLGRSRHEVAKMWPAVKAALQKSDDGRYFSADIEAKRQKQIEFRERAAAAGRDGADRRYGKNGENRAQESRVPYRVDLGYPIPDPVGSEKQTLQGSGWPFNARVSFRFYSSLSLFFAGIEEDAERLGPAKPSRAYAFTAWFVARGLMANAIPPDRALDFVATFSRESLEDASALTTAYEPDDLEARTARFFAAIAARTIDRMPASVASLRRAIDWNVVVGRTATAAARSAPLRELHDGSVNGMPVTIPPELRR